MNEIILGYYKLDLTLLRAYLEKVNTSHVIFYSIASQSRVIFANGVCGSAQRSCKCVGTIKCYRLSIVLTHTFIFRLNTIEQHLTVPTQIVKIPALHQQLIPTLDILARNQFITTVLNQLPDALKSRVKMELQPDDPAPASVLERLILACIRLCDPCSSKRQVIRVAVPVKRCESFRKLSEHPGFAGSVSEPHVEPSDLRVSISVNLCTENACDQLGAEADPENDSVGVDRVFDEDFFSGKPGEPVIFVDVHRTAHYDQPVELFQFR